MGNFDRTPLRNSSGVTGAAPIFHDVMLAADRRARGGMTASASERIVPPGTDVAQREVCALSGMSANQWCPNRKREWMAADTHDLPCSWHHGSDHGLLTILPPEYATWGASHRLRGVYAQGAGASPGVRGADAEAAGASHNVRRPDVVKAGHFSIASPAHGSTYLIDPTLRREFQTLALKVVAGSGAIAWSVDGRSVGKSRDPLDWPLAPGIHRISARDARGRTAEVTITVR